MLRCHSSSGISPALTASHHLLTYQCFTWKHRMLQLDQECNTITSGPSGSWWELLQSRQHLKGLAWDQQLLMDHQKCNEFSTASHVNTCIRLVGFANAKTQLTQSSEKIQRLPNIYNWTCTETAVLLPSLHRLKDSVCAHSTYVRPSQQPNPALLH